MSIIYFIFTPSAPYRAITGDTNYYDLSQVAVLLHAATNMLTTPYVLITRRLPTWLMVSVGIEMLFSIVLSDFETLHTTQNRAWPLAVVVIEFFIFLDTALRYVVIMVLIMCSYLLVATLEVVFPYGLRGIIDKEYTLCSCTSPPCGGDTFNFVRAFGLITAVFTVNVFLVERFARDLKMEKRSVEASVELAGKIATALSRFDVALAEETIEEAVNLPSQLRNAFSDLVSNLRMYRPYLPDSCLTWNGVPDPSAISESGSNHSSQVTTLVAESLREAQTSLVAQDVRPFDLTRKRVTLTVITLPHYLDHVDVDTIESIQANWLEVCVTSIHSSRGILDEFNGDKVVAVFNGAKACVTHAASALKCSLQIAEEATQPVSIAVMTARAICGDLGTAEVRRYSVVGGIQQETRLLQHLGWEWGYQVLCTESTFLEAPTIQGRLLIERVQFSGGAPTHKLYEVLRESDVAEEEWMYQLQSAQSGTLSLCNKATELAQDGDFTQALSDLQEAMPTVTGEYADLLATAMRCIEGASGGKQTLFKVGPLRLQGDTAEEPRESTPLVNSF